MLRQLLNTSRDYRISNELRQALPDSWARYAKALSAICRQSDNETVTIRQQHVFDAHDVETHDYRGVDRNICTGGSKNYTKHL